MFNSTIYKNESKVVAVTKEIEKTISPDKVVDMYDKTFDEVEKRILRSFVFDDNQLRGVVVEYQPLYEQRARRVGVRFTLNGTEHIDQFDIKEETLTREGAYKLLMDSLNYSITTEVARNFLPLMKS